MTTGRFHGAFTALVTPFKNGKIDEEAYREFIEWQIEQGIDGLVPCGTTGESATMTHDEHEAAIRICVEQVNKRVPVIAGAGSNNTREAIPLTQFAKNVGADAALHITPYYNKPTQEGLYQHFKTICSEVSMPVILYNVPGRTGCGISEDVVRRLSVHPNIMGIKEASGNLSYTAKIARYVNEDFALYSGNDDMVLPILSLGGSGVISVLANILPRQTHDMVMDYLNGDRQKALEAQLGLLDVINGLFLEVNPIPVKEAMNQMGMEVGGYRQPLGPLGEAARAKLTAALKAAGLV